MAVIRHQKVHTHKACGAELIKGSEVGTTTTISRSLETHAKEQHRAKRLKDLRTGPQKYLLLLQNIHARSER